MHSLFITIYRMMITTKYNKVLYYIEKIPVIGRTLSGKYYNAKYIESWLHYVCLIIAFLFSLVKKVLFFILLYFISDLLRIFVERITLPQENIFFTVVVVTLLISGTLFKSFFIDTINEQDILAIKIFRIPPTKYYQLKLTMDFVSYFVLNSLALGLIYYFSNGSVILGPLIIFSVVCIRTLSTWVMIKFYKQGLNPLNEFWSWMTIIASLVIGFLTVGGFFLGLYLPVDWILNPWFVLLISSLLALGIWGWTKETGLDSIVYRSLSFETLKTHQNRMDNLQTSTVTLEETDFKAVRHEEQLSEKTGIDYLNALFFERTRHYIFAHIKRRLTFTLIGCAVLIGFTTITGFTFTESQQFFYVVGLVSFIASNYFYYSEEFSKFCFYNLDRKLMKYRFYREPDIVMRSIKIRFYKAIKLNLPVLMIIMLFTTLLFLISDSLSLWALLLSLGFQFILMLFYSLNYLILYYLIQPYTESMKTKSFVYKAVNLLFLSFLFFSFNIDIDFLPIIIPVVTVFMLLYVIGGLIGVYKYSPKNFKLRT